MPIVGIILLAVAGWCGLTLLKGRAVNDRLKVILSLIGLVFFGALSGLVIYLDFITSVG